MYQPNFLEVESRLNRAIAFCAEHSDFRSSKDYRHRLVAVLAHFETTTRQTDELHTRWRLRLGEQLLACKRARQDWDRVVALCDEHAIDGVPSRRIVYTETEQLKALLEETIAFLEGLDDDWPWIEEEVRVLRQRIAEARALVRETNAIFKNYTVEVKRRVAAWEDAVALLKEYLGDSKWEGDGVEGYRAIELRLD